MRYVRAIIGTLAVALFGFTCAKLHKEWTKGQVERAIFQVELCEGVCEAHGGTNYLIHKPWQDYCVCMDATTVRLP